MTLINSWKNSLQLLKPSNLKQLFWDTFSILPTVYINFFKFIPVIIILTTALVLYYTFVTHILIAHYIVIPIFSILSAFTVMAIYAIVKDAVAHEQFSFKKHKQHLIVGTCILSLFFTLAYFYLMYGLIELTSSLAELRIRNLAYMAKKGITNPVYAKYGNKLFFDISLVMLTFVFLYIQMLAGLFAFTCLYFLDSMSSIQSFFKAIFRGIKLLFYCLPGLIVIYGSLYILGLGVEYILRDADIGPLLLAIFTIVPLPLGPALNAQLYKRLKI